MEPGVHRPGGSRFPWAVLGKQLLLSLPWAAALLAFVAILWCFKDWEGRLLYRPVGDSLLAAVQVVPAIVIAIFVFAVGTLFVVAQFVPPVRGTRAVEVLRKRHVAWTIPPALVLAPASALVLLLKKELASILASGVLLGTVVYLLASTACLLNILREATDPDAFSELMERMHERATDRLKRSPRTGAPTRVDLPVGPRAGVGRTRPTWSKPDRYWWTGRPANAQAAANDLYDIVRTLRGWTRTAATSGDSRELFVSLEATLKMVRNYETDVDDRHVLPEVYWENADSPDTNPSKSTDDTTGWPNQDSEDAVRAARYGPWFPAQLKLEPPCKGEQRRRGDARSVALPATWVANEVGRSLVRAVEFAATTRTLLERDRGRLLLTMDKAARQFSGRHPESAGVMVAYLIELGLGVRRCPPDDIDWHFDPLATLARLHRYFDANVHHEQLTIGTGAGVLKVAEAITGARARDRFHGEPLAAATDPTCTKQQENVWPPLDRTCLHIPDEVRAIARQTCTELRNIPGLAGFTLSAGSSIHEEAVRLAQATWFEPRDLPFILPTNYGIVHVLEKILHHQPA